MNTKLKFKDFLFKNYHLIALLLFTVTNIYILSRVGLAADDSWYKNMSDCSPSLMLDFFKWHYTHENGRLLAHILAVLFLKNKITFILWKALLTLSLIFYSVIIAKLVVPKNKKASVTLVVFLYMTVTFGIYATAVYWLTGSFNYFFPSLMFLILMYTSLKKPKSPFLIILGFLCGATMEQTGIMTIGWFVLLIVNNLIRKKKYNIYFVFCTIFAVTGYATVLLAPGTSTRLSNQGFQGIRPMLINLLTVIRKNWIDNASVAVMIFILAICVSYWLYKFRNKNKFAAKCTAPIIVYIILASIINFCYNVMLTATGFIGINIPYSAKINTVIGVLWGIYAVLFIVSTLYVAIRLYTEKQAFLPVSVIILGFGSQMTMSASSNAPERTCFSTVTMFMIFIVYSSQFLYHDIKLHAKSKTLKLILKPFIVRGLATVMCLFACIYQLAFFAISQNTYSDIDSLGNHPISVEEFADLTKDREQKNHEFYSDSNSEWNAEYDVFSFLPK